MFRVILMLAVALFAAPSVAADPAKPASAAADQPDREKKVCRPETGTGSIMPKRVCRTKAEWAEMNGKGGALADVARDRQETSALTQATLGRN